MTKNFIFKFFILNQNLKLDQMDFKFIFLTFTCVKKKKTCHDYHNFKWQKKIKIFSFFVTKSTI